MVRPTPLVIVAYTPEPGKAAQLLASVQQHLEVLQKEEFVTDKPAYVMKSGGGTIVESLAWHSAEAIEKAHDSPAVQEL